MLPLLRSSLALAAVLTPALSAQNLLQNPGFDGPVFAWGQFGNAFLEGSPLVPARSAPFVMKMFGNFTGSFNVTGIFQSFPALPGQSFTLDCWSAHASGDAITGPGAPTANWAVMKIAFFDAANVEIGGAEQTIIDGTYPTDVWIDNPAVTGVAPANTASVQALILFLQPGTAGGALLVDDCVFTGPPPARPAYPGSGEDLELRTGVAGAPATTGPGFDVKQAAGGQLLQLNVWSPQGTFDRAPFWVFAQAFTTGVPQLPSLPNVYFDPARPIVAITGNLPSPIGGPVIAPGTGSSSWFVAPAGMAGTSVMLQTLVVTPAANNGMFAISDGHEIQLQ
ncbi:MAG: hypothetical protein IPM29_13215 [Planctomycetes bacterium]|nr:hypothetical protein [Planctomycetota bacterium]